MGRNTFARMRRGTVPPTLAGDEERFKNGLEKGFLSFSPSAEQRPAAKTNWLDHVRRSEKSHPKENEKRRC